MKASSLTKQRYSSYYEKTKKFISLTQQEQKHAILLMKLELQKLPFYRSSFEDIINVVTETQVRLGFTSKFNSDVDAEIEAMKKDLINNY